MFGFNSCRLEFKTNFCYLFSVSKIVYLKLFYFSRCTILGFGVRYSFTVRDSTVRDSVELAKKYRGD